MWLAPFFVLIPLIIYIAAYLPYWWREVGFSLGVWWQCQLTMFNYHSQLKSTHPYESNRDTWSFLLRPVWYYSASGLPAGIRGTIADGKSHRVVGGAGRAVRTGLAADQRPGVPGAGECAGAVSGAAAALVLVTRCTFLYHYFPSCGLRWRRWF